VALENGEHCPKSGSVKRKKNKLASKAEPTRLMGPSGEIIIKLRADFRSTGVEN
jgi:hypothetical protein